MGRDYRILHHCTQQIHCWGQHRHDRWAAWTGQAWTPWTGQAWPPTAGKAKLQNTWGQLHPHHKQCRLTDEPYCFDADACDTYRKTGICVFHLRGMCKRPTCDLQHITKDQATQRGLPPITTQTVFPITQVEIPMQKEEEPDFTTRDTSHLPTYDEPEMFFTIFHPVE